MADDARADAVRVASEPDAWLARSLVITARQVADDGRVLQSAAWPPLVALLEQSARGDLGRHEWSAAMHEALPRAPGTPARSVGQLMDDLATSVPPGAHAVRVRRALDTGNRDARELVLLLQGALIAADATLQLELLAQLRARALAPLGILGLLQQPFLLRALDSVSATAADPDESAHTRHVLAAAELARRGDQRGARHGCVLIDGEGRVLGENSTTRLPPWRVAGASASCMPRRTRSPTRSAGAATMARGPRAARRARTSSSYLEAPATMTRPRAVSASCSFAHSGCAARCTPRVMAASACASSAVAA